MTYEKQDVDLGVQLCPWPSCTLSPAALEVGRVSNLWCGRPGKAGPAVTQLIDSSRIRIVRVILVPELESQPSEEEMPNLLWGGVQKPSSLTARGTFHLNEKPGSTEACFPVSEK